ncbi:hypothetical protein WT60_02410 [Burkholderia sp. MSMB617WGS]|nr:hypothetical protein WT60_02410 [Burkholderia sp. MSMB617WGS]
MIRALLVGFGEVAVRPLVDDQAAVAPREPDEICNLVRAEVGAALEDVHHALERRRRPDGAELAPLVDVVELVVEHHAANARSNSDMGALLIDCLCRALTNRRYMSSAY